MLGKRDAVANVAVKDLQTAKKFYKDTLGLEPVEAKGDDMIAFKSGNSTLYVYESQFAGTNKATAVTWEVGLDVEELVGELKAKGIKFEHYDLPGLEARGDLYVGHGMKCAWFKDPDGNILSVSGK